MPAGPLKIDILLAGGTLTYEEGVGICQHINIHFYFANVVHVHIHFTDLTREDYYQVPVILYTPAPIP